MARPKAIKTKNIIAGAQKVIGITGEWDSVMGVCVGELSTHFPQASGVYVDWIKYQLQRRLMTTEVMLKAMLLSDDNMSVPSMLVDFYEKYKLERTAVNERVRSLYANVAYDIVTFSMVPNPVLRLASLQTIESQVGDVYYYSSKRNLGWGTLAKKSVIAEVGAVPVSPEALDKADLLKGYYMSFTDVSDNDLDAIFDLGVSLHNAELDKVLGAYAEMANIVESTDTHIEFSMQHPDGVSEDAHIQSFGGYLHEARSRLFTKHGTDGNIVYLVGKNALSIIEKLTGFEPITSAKADVHAKVVGMCEGCTIIQTNRLFKIKAPSNTNVKADEYGYVDPDNVIITARVNYNDPFDMPVADVTYLPVFPITSAVAPPSGDGKMSFVEMFGYWRAVEILNADYVKPIFLY